jgi:hypothetical protein
MTENGSNGVSIRQGNMERDKIKHSIPISNRTHLLICLNTDYHTYNMILKDLYKDLAHCAYLCIDRKTDVKSKYI